MNNEQIFTKNTQDLKEKNMLQAQSSWLESVVIEAYRIVPDLHILVDAQSEAKIRKLVASLREAKVEVGRVQFELNMKITELQLKLQPTTPPEIKEQCGAMIKKEWPPWMP